MSEEYFEQNNESLEKLEKQQQFLKALGLDSIITLWDVIEGINENLQKTEKNTEKYYELLAQKEYFEEGLKQFEEV